MNKHLECHSIIKRIIKMEFLVPLVLFYAYLEASPKGYSFERFPMLLKKKNKKNKYLHPLLFFFP